MFVCLINIGESIPVSKKKGNNVFGATINQTGVIYVKAEKLGSSSMLNQILQLKKKNMNNINMNE